MPARLERVIGGGILVVLEHFGIVGEDILREYGEGALVEGLADAPHEVEEEVEVVDGHEAGAENLVGVEEMADVGAGEMAAGVAGAALLDAIVLAVISREKDGTYGYKITQDVRSVLEVSESTLYPVLRRLQKDECLEAYNMEYAGRNRKYYKLTDKGAAQLNLYRSEWEIYSSKITRMFEEGV